MVETLRRLRDFLIVALFQGLADAFAKSSFDGRQSMMPPPTLVSLSPPLGQMLTMF